MALNYRFTRSGSVSLTMPFSEVVSLYPRHRLQHLQRPTSSDFPKTLRQFRNHAMGLWQTATAAA